MKSTIKEIRSSINVNFFDWDSVTVQYMNEKFEKTKKILDRKVSYSEDKLTRIHNLEFASYTDALEFTNDAILNQARSKKLKYDIEHGIRVLRTAD